MNNDSKLSSILLFLASYPFTKKLNAIGISNLPTALKAYQNTKKEDLKNDVKQKMHAYFMTLFHSSAAFSGLFGRYPKLIQAHAIVGIGAAVKDSITVRKEEEERARLEAERRAESRGGSISRTLQNWIFGSTSSSSEEDDDDGKDNKDNKEDTKEEEVVSVLRTISSVSAAAESEKEAGSSPTKQEVQEVVDAAKSKGQKLSFKKRFFKKSSKSSSNKKDAKDTSIIPSMTPASASSLSSSPSSPASTVTSTPSRSTNANKPKKSKTVKAQKVLKRTKSILKGKRDSSTDDIIWGVFQASFVLLDQTIGKALAYAWLLFLLTVLEEAVFNPKLSKEQRLKRFCWILATGYFSGKLVLPDWSAIAGESTVGTVGQGGDSVY